MKKFRTLFTLILALSSLLLPAAAAESENKKRRRPCPQHFSWADNFNPEVIKEFEKI